MTGDGGLIEVQATAERTPVSRASLDSLLSLAEPAIAALRDAQAGRDRRASRRAERDARGAWSWRRETTTSSASWPRSSTGVELVPLPAEVELPPETGETFADNALIKARAAHAATGAAAIADDSGIEARALGGRPGVRSARYAGEDATDEQNLAKLIDELRDADDRSVAYVCVIAHVDDAGAESLYEGRCEGTLTLEPRGSGGFGYDPAFVPADTGADDRRTMAELEPAEKHAISHRGRRGAKAGGGAGGTVIRTKSGAAGLSIASNSLLIALKLVAGAITGSIAIITEAVHSSIDLLASVIAFVSVRRADEPPDAEHPYGHERLENLAAAIEGMLIIVGAGVIVFEATRRLVNGAEVERLGLGIAVIAFSAVANVCVSAYLSTRQARSARRRSRATPPTCAPTRSPRSG